MLYYVFAAVLALAAVAFLVLLLRQGLPRERTAWVGVALSVALLCASVAVALLAGQMNRPAPVPIEELAAPPQVAVDDLGKPAADLAVRLLAGERDVRLSDFRGRVVLLNFWATWCVPCLKELPDLDLLQQRYGALGLQVIAVSDESPEVLRAFESRLPLEVAVAYLPGGTALAPVYDQGIAFRPVSYLIDRDGVLRRVEVGARPYAFFEGLVQDLLQPGLAMR